MPWKRMKREVDAVTLMEEACRSFVISGRPGKYTVEESPGIAPVHVLEW
jgi:hypothetical protein